VDVALSTSAAPTYFPAHLLPSGSALADGGIWANNPVGLAVVEAIGVLGWPASDIEVLSIGCTSEPIGTGGITRTSLGLSYGVLGLLICSCIRKIRRRSALPKSLPAMSRLRALIRWYRHELTSRKKQRKNQKNYNRDSKKTDCLNGH